MYKVKEGQKRRTAIRYQGYGPFASGNGSAENRIASITLQIQAGQYEAAIAASSELLQHAIQGLRYVQTYDWLFLRALVTLGYLGWIAYASITVIDLHVLQGASDAVRSTTSTIVFSSTLLVLYASFHIQSSPFRYYAYAVFPVVFWEEVFARKQVWATGSKVLFRNVSDAKGYLSFAFEAGLFILVLQALVSRDSSWFGQLLADRFRYNLTFIVPYSQSVISSQQHGQPLTVSSFCGTTKPWSRLGYSVVSSSAPSPFYPSSRSKARSRSRWEVF